jgi:thymidylate kinase
VNIGTYFLDKCETFGLIADGTLVTVEGPDGVGKTRLAEALVDHLETLDIPSRYMAFPGKQAGTLGHLIYEVHHHTDRFGIMSLNATSRQLLHVAAQVDQIEGLILPAVRSGQIVVLDRFWWSVWVYGILDGADPESLNKMIDLERHHWSNVVPAAAFLVERAAPLRRESWDPDFEVVRQLYADLARKESQHYPVAIISNEGSIQAALRAVLGELQNLQIIA